jgi:Ca2+-binding EF-hand superfamily protein
MSVDPFLIKKWEKAFHTFFDTAATGDIQWADFYVVTKKVKDIYGADSEQMTLAKSCLHTLWDVLQQKADRNKDKVIDMAEWEDVLKTHDPEHESSWFQKYCQFLFKLFDVSADNFLDIAEYADGMVCYGMEEHDAHAAFKKFAVDGSGKYIGKINFKQFKELWIQYFYSTKPDAPGNHLFGVWKD